MSDPRTLEIQRQILGALKSIDARLKRNDTRLEQALNVLGELNSNMARMLDHYRELHVQVAGLGPPEDSVTHTLGEDIKRLERELQRLKGAPNVTPGRNRAPPRRA